MSADRELVADELARYLAAVGLSDPWSDDPGASTRWRYSDDGELYEASRLQLHTRLVDEELARTPPMSRQASPRVIITAGPPGAGKSTALAATAEAAGYRSIDADAFKDALLILERDTGILSTHLAHSLADGRPLAVRELAAFVHAESTTIANTMRERCLSAGENLIIHGTLSSTDHTDELLAQLNDHSYNRLLILDVETDADRAIDQALQRWWTARTIPENALGGRFVAPAYIRTHYPLTSPESICARNARTLHTRAQSLGWAAELRTL